MGGKSISLWMLEQPPQTFAAEVLPEREMGESSEGLLTGGGGVGSGSGHGAWLEVWHCEMAVPVVHLKFSPDSLLFATAGEVGLHADMQSMVAHKGTNIAVIRCLISFSNVRRKLCYQFEHCSFYTSGK